MLEEETFQKVRRNLVGVSVLVIADKIGNLRFCTVDLLGNNFVIANQSIIPVLLAIATAYCFLRYLTSFNSVSGWSKVTGGFCDIMNNHLGAMLQRRYRKELGTIALGSPTKSWGSWHYTFWYGNPSNFPREVTIGPSIIMMARAMALLQVCVWTTLFLEYIFPFLIALFAIAELAGLPLVKTTDGLIVAAPCKEIAGN